MESCFLIMLHFFIFCLITITQVSSRQRLFVSEPHNAEGNNNAEWDLVSTNKIFFPDEGKDKDTMDESDLNEPLEHDTIEDIETSTLVHVTVPEDSTDETSENSPVLVHDQTRTSSLSGSYGGSKFSSGSNSMSNPLNFPFSMGNNWRVRNPNVRPIPSVGSYPVPQPGAYQPNNFNLNSALRASGQYPGIPFSGLMPSRPQPTNYYPGQQSGGFYPGIPQSFNFNQGNTWPSFPSQGQNSQCLEWCRAGNGYGSFHCCQGKEVNLVNLASFEPQCPAPRPSCLNVIRTNAPVLCNNDQQCLNQLLPSKCCQDTCLKEFVCKPAMMPRGPLAGHLTQTKIEELVPK